MITAIAGRGANKRPARAQRKTALVGLAFIAPALIGLTALYLVPLANTLLISLSKTGPFGGGTFTGLDNYATLAESPEFLQALGHSLIYTLIVLLGIPASVIVATLINSVKRGQNVYRVLYFIPVVTLPVAVGMVWRYIYNGDFGLLNQLLSTIGIVGPSWVADPDVAIYAVAIVGIWMSLGTNIIILGAGLQNMPKELLEASELDGAGPIKQFFHVTLPLLSPSIFFVSVLSVISSLQMFDLIYVMIGRSSPALEGSRTIVYLFYQKSFVEYDRGLGAAIAIVLLMLIVVATAIQFRLQRRWVFYG
ncbi:carbohydrate ABC transporter permease [Arthrobacter sp. NPDC058127]|uniref:carbohydrate ABC transporter permease n=1 Tax=Arthrobacter sp. NPDC058127 TaxID=3346351 RepID=UPI0036EF8759